MAEKKISRSRVTDSSMGDANISLVLKIAMRDVTKPPVWREAQIPGSFNFLQLHRVIQSLYALGDYHLWCFGRCAYDQELSIGPSEEDCDFFNTHEAKDTAVLEFLKDVGDKLVYTYDSGDSWEFSVTVRQVVDERIEHPIFTKWKGNLQPMEDSGGAWCYMQMRDFLTNEATLKPKQKKEIAANLCYESPRELADCLREQIIDPEIITDDLEEIK
jgi:hypothetical protein